MKLSTRSRYGTRMMFDLAEHYNDGPIQLGDISKRQDISVKYLEQLIIPLKKGDYINSVRGPKGGHMLAKRPEEITIGEIVNVLEGGIDLTGCVGNPDECQRSSSCPTRSVWEEGTKAMYDKLNSITLREMAEKRQRV
jgi:Rrf2 family iron-sulfur cluster assembly transcriptional regulator